MLASLVAALCLAPSIATHLNVTLRERVPSPVGRTDWLESNACAAWAPSETAIVVVDMWDVHWCAFASTRVAALAPMIQQWTAAARAANVTVVWAPSDCTDFYAGSGARNNTLALPAATPPAPSPVAAPAFPLDTSTNAGCDDPRSEAGAPWTRQISTLQIDDKRDFLISDDGGDAEVSAARERVSSRARW